MSFSTSSVWATSVSQLPTCEIELTAEEQAEVAEAERAERLAGPWRLLSRASASLVDDPLEHVERRGEPVELVGVELAAAGARARRCAAVRLASSAASRPRGDRDEADPPVRRGGRRSTNPAASILSTTLVIVGGATRSCAARSPSVSGPFSATVDSAAVSVGPRPLSSCWRSSRARRTPENRRLARDLDRVGGGGAIGGVGAREHKSQDTR